MDPLTKAYRKLHERLDKLKKEHPDKADDEAILTKVTELFANRVGSPYSIKELEEIYRKGQQRYEKRVPPGYADEKKSKQNDERKYGDLVLWLQMIDKASESKKPVLFVTDDEKNDWWRKREDGSRVGPRPELVEEMQRQAGVHFHLYSVADFMQEAKGRLKAKVSDQTVRTAHQVQRMLLPFSGNEIEIDEKTRELMQFLKLQLRKEEEKRNQALQALLEIIRRDQGHLRPLFETAPESKSASDQPIPLPDWLRWPMGYPPDSGWAERTPGSKKADEPETE